MLGKNEIFLGSWIILQNINYSSCVVCHFYDRLSNQIRTTYCPQACCLTASNIENACCFNWTWVFALIVVLPIVFCILVICLLFYYIFKKKTLGVHEIDENSYVDPVVNSPVFNQSIYTVFPPAYNEQTMSNNCINITGSTRPTQISASLEPPAYHSVVNSISRAALKSESQPHLITSAPKLQLSATI
ncbi:unnamed protein product [Brachionus calyciflorus]|uniref:Uncharacterized protein n=1 Tax=Brachionus calyciflorus TaxID=104777 RepID=A0A813MI39_9BILA|nr:unnamed protein product [Brachionus calyciflorus]